MVGSNGFTFSTFLKSGTSTSDELPGAIILSLKSNLCAFISVPPSFTARSTCVESWKIFRDSSYKKLEKKCKANHFFVSHAQDKLLSDLNLKLLPYMQWFQRKARMNAEFQSTHMFSSKLLSLLVLESNAQARAAI